MFLLAEIDDFYTMNWHTENKSSLNLNQKIEFAVAVERPCFAFCFLSKIFCLFVKVE